MKPRMLFKDELDRMAKSIESMNVEQDDLFSQVINMLMARRVWEPFRKLQ